MTPNFVRRSEAPVRAVPVPLEATPPKPKRAARAGFGMRAGQVAEILTKKRRLLLVRAGADMEEAGATAVARLSAVEHIAIDARDLTPVEAAHLAAGAVLRAWRFRRFLTVHDSERPVLEELDVLVRDVAAAEAAWAELQPGVQGAIFARDLVVEPGNELTPSGFAAQLTRLVADGIDLEVFDANRLQAEGFGALLAVGRASANPPCLAILRWPGTRPEPPVLFVGKGITFDTGGISIKPAQGLWEMRADMAGAAACAGAMLAVARRRSPAPVVAVLPLAENAIGADAYRPGDVLRTHSGTTVEIVDTDAEGRLVLADALSYATERFKPQAAIDLATLTGSMVIALGHHMAGMFATDDALAAHVAGAAKAVAEPVWRMPLDDGYASVLDSDIADVRQCSEGRLQPDACHAALFLRRFVGDTPWVHLDIAGMDSRVRDRPASGGADRVGARLLDRLVQDRFERDR